MKCVIIAVMGLAAISAVSGCSKKDPPAGGAPSATASSPGASGAPSAQSSAPYQVASATPSSFLTPSQRFAAEKQNRPTATVTVEQVMTATRSAGVTLTDEKQHLGSSYGASYCVGAKASGGAAFSVCEYKTKAEAMKGRADSLKAFSKIAGRTVHINTHTTLTLLAPEGSAEGAASAKKILAAFAAVKPAPRQADAEKK